VREITLDRGARSVKVVLGLRQLDRPGKKPAVTETGLAQNIPRESDLALKQSGGCLPTAGCGGRI